MKHMLRWAWMLLLMVGYSSVGPQNARCDANRGWYLNGGVGLNHLDVEEGRDPTPDVGFRVVAAGGFQFNRNLAVEFDSGFIRNTFSESEDPETRDNPIQQVPLVFNALYSFSNPSKFEPFLGAGIGVIYVRTGDSDGGDVSLAFKGGVRYGIDERMAVGVDYTFFMLGFVSAFIGEAVGDDTVNLAVHWMY